MQLNTQKENRYISLKQINQHLLHLRAGRPKDIEKELEVIQSHLNNKSLKNTKEKFTFIDLFAGIGGMRLGFECAGGKCVMSSEIDKKALATYLVNFDEYIPEQHQDITKISELEIPNHDVLVAGFPCQAFSVAGERKGFQDTRGTLFFDIQRILSFKKPKAFLLENVKGLLNHDHGKTYKTIIDTLEKKLNYKVFSKVLNTMEYGNIPQTRERIYIVGFSNDFYKPNMNFSFPNPVKLNTSIEDCLEKNQIDQSLYYKKYRMHSKLEEEMLQTNTVYQWRRKYVRENKSNVCPTLTANMGTGGHNVPLIREKTTRQIRKLSPRECANFQGFPKNFYIPKFMAKSCLYKQFGNSVSVPVIKILAQSIEKILTTKT